MADLEHGESDYVSPQDKFEPKSTAWYATTPVIKWLYKYTMYGCTNKPVMNEVQLPPDEDHDEEGGEKSIISPSDKEEESEIETEVAPLDEIEVQGEGFSTSFGIFFSCVGSVIGSGNIWRFPRIVAQNSYSEGSAAFLLVWMISLFLWSIPIIIIEFTIGRFTKTGPLLTFGKFLGTKLLGWGTWTIMICYLISTYYNVIVGWCFYYVYYVCAAAELPSNETLSIEIFDTFTQKTSYPVLCHFLSLFLASVCVVGGLSWIEWVNSTLVTILAIILIVTLGWALSLPYADIGIQYLFSPAWYSIAQPRLWIDAFIQNAFDTGAGLGHYAVYAGFFKRTDKSVTYAITLPIINNMVSLISGISIFSTVFATMITTRPTLTITAIKNLMQESGPGSTGLTFTWIPVLYQTMGVAGRVLCGLFFICLSFAGLTTQISNLQLTLVTLKNCGLAHYVACAIAILSTFLLGLPSAMNINILTNQDFTWGFGLIISGVLYCVIPMYYGCERFRRVIINEYGIGDIHVYFIWTILVILVVPVLGAVFIIRWAIDLLSGPDWAALSETSFFTIIIEWAVLVVLIVIFNILVIKCNWSVFDREGAGGFDPYHLEECEAFNPDYHKQLAELRKSGHHEGETHFVEL